MCPTCDYLTGLRDKAPSGSAGKSNAIVLLDDHEAQFHPERCEHGLTRSECNSDHIPDSVKRYAK
jgi:hypothetical protein